MLLEKNVVENMNEVALAFSLIFIVGMVITYLGIIYLLIHPKRKRLLLTYTSKLETFAQSRSVIQDPNDDHHILLVNSELS
jgi:hypothetical protein